MTDKRAVIVCSHVAKGLHPVSVAVRDEPLDEVDSGWQIRCDLEQHGDDDLAQVWGVCEVLELEPGLAEFVEYAPGTRLTKSKATSKWVQTK